MLDCIQSITDVKSLHYAQEECSDMVHKTLFMVVCMQCMHSLTL